MEIKDIVDNFIKLDEFLDLMAPGFVLPVNVDNKNFPWQGIKNLNRAVYFTLTFYNYFFEKTIVDVSIVVDKKNNESILLEVKKVFIDLVETGDIVSCKYEAKDVPATLLIIIKDIYKFMCNNYDQFNNFFEHDPNIKYLASTKNKTSKILDTDNQEIIDYYKKISTQMFVNK